MPDNPTNGLLDDWGVVEAVIALNRAQMEHNLPPITCLSITIPRERMLMLMTNPELAPLRISVCGVDVVIEESQYELLHNPTGT